MARNLDGEGFLYEPSDRNHPHVNLVYGIDRRHRRVFGDRGVDWRGGLTLTCKHKLNHVDTVSDRKTRAPKYTPDRAAMILAEAEIAGDVPTCAKWDITRQTLHNYRVKLKTDDELLQLLTLHRRLLTCEWVNDAVRAIKVAAAEVSRRMPIATTEEEAKIITAIASTAKTFGDLQITMKAFEGETDEKIQSVASDRR